MRDFEFYNPTRIVFGRGKNKDIAYHINTDGIKKVLVVYGMGSVHKNGVYDEVIKALELQGIAFIELNGVLPNPRLDKVREGIAMAKESEVEAILALGGGSVFDTAKAIAAGCKSDRDVWDYFTKEASIKDALPIYGILTLSATGSEMNCNSVITKLDEYKKWTISHECLYPRVSIIDPQVQCTLSDRQTINGAVDIIVHVLEEYFDNTKNMGLLEEYSEGIIRTVIKEAPILLNRPDNYSSRAQFAWAATLALNSSTAVGRMGDWASHKIEHALGAYYDIDHGAGLSIVFPAWAKYVLHNNPKVFARFADRVFNIKDGDDYDRGMKGILCLQDFFKSINSPLTLKEIGIPKEDLDKVADNVALIGSVGSMQSLSRDDVYNILISAYEK